MVMLYAGGSNVQADLWTNEDRTQFFLRSSYDPGLVRELRSLNRRKWLREERVWRFGNSARNRFVLSLLMGLPVYARYDEPLVPVSSHRPLVPKQREVMIPHVLQRRRCILAGDMGTGKTLVMIEAMERLPAEWNWWWVGPAKSLAGIKRQFEWEWEARKHPESYWSYEAFRAHVPGTTRPPRGIVFDESDFLKNPSSGRGQIALELSEGMDSDYGEECAVVLLSGYPAPQDPSDWWGQCEIARPGWLREPNRHKFLERLAVLEYDTVTPDRKAFHKVYCWRRGQTLEKRVKIGQRKVGENEYEDEFLEAGTVLSDAMGELSSCLQGLVLRVGIEEVNPELRELCYEERSVEPSQKLRNVARTVVDTCGSVGKALNLLRQLSDGFQYTYDGRGLRKTLQVSHAPKDELLRRELERAERLRRRVVIYGGFQGTIDRLVQLCQEEGWNVIRCDGRGWCWFGQPTREPSQRTFQSEDVSDKIAFVGHPAAAGKSLTLTAAETIVFYSNDFNGGSREQAERRHARWGQLDRPRIVDLYCLGTDRYVRNRLREKGGMARSTLFDLRKALE